MSFITELDVVNRCIATMGELGINSLEGSRNPIVTNAREAFKDVTIEQQAIGWWFNNELVKLLPQTDGTYFVPTDTLSLSTTSEFNPNWLTIRARKLYDVGNAEYYTGTQEVKVQITRLLPFGDLPYNAQRLIRDAAVLKFQQDYDSDEIKISQCETAYAEAFALCKADHIRAVGANLLYRGDAGSAVARMRFPYGRTGRFR